MKTTSQTNYTPYQLKLPLELSTVIETTDAVYTFCEVIDHIDLINIESCLVLVNVFCMVNIEAPVIMLGRVHSLFPGTGIVPGQC